MRSQEALVEDVLDVMMGHLLVPLESQTGELPLWVPRIPSTQVRPPVGIRGSDRRRRRCDASLPAHDHRWAAVSPS